MWCLGADWQECGLQEHIANGCQCPDEQPVCGETCTMNPDNCSDGTTCQDIGGGNKMCVGDDWQECDLQTHIGNDCECPPVQDMCPYDSTEARLQKDSGSDWVSYLTLSPGMSFNVGSFHNASGSPADDTSYEVVGPNGFYYHCDERSEDCFGHTVTNVKEGDYALYVGTFNQSGGLYPEDACKDQAYAHVSVKPPEKEKNFSVSKVIDGPREYKVGDKMTFKVVIKNTGDLVLDTLTYVDKYDSRYVSLLKITGERWGGGKKLVSKELSYYNLSKDGNFARVKIDDITVQLGDLGLNEKYVLYAKFEAIAVSGTVKAWNYAIVDHNGKQKEDGDYVYVKPEDAPPVIPPTDR